jgi:hypothetical protein
MEVIEMKRVFAMSVLILSAVALGSEPSAKGQNTNLMEVCAVPTHFQVRNLAIDGWGKARTFSNEPGAFVGNIFARDAVPQKSVDISLNGSGYVLVDCGRPQILRLHCGPNLSRCVEPLALTNSQRSSGTRLALRPGASVLRQRRSLRRFLAEAILAQ